MQAGVTGTSIAITGRGVSPKCVLARHDTWCGVVWCGVVWCGVVWCVLFLPLLESVLLTSELRFTLEPSTPAIDMGDILAGEEGTAQLKLTNTVSFALQYSVVVQNIGRSNANGTQSFDAMPADAVVPQSSFKDIQVSFRPDDESPFYSCALEVVVPNQKEKSVCVARLPSLYFCNTLARYTLLGRCWAQAMYCRLPVSLSDPLPSALARTLGPGAAVGAGGIDRFDPPSQGAKPNPCFNTLNPE